MRVPNYKVGWLISDKIAALTHFHSEIIQEDMLGVFAETQKLLQDIKEAFQIIIDNRLAPLNKIYTLEELQSSSPLLNHPLLKNIVMVKPNHLELGKEHIDLETRNNIHLKNVSSIQEAIDFICQVNVGFVRAEINTSFFPNT